MGFSRREDWSGLPCPPQGDVPTPGSEPRLLHSGWIPLPSEPPVKHQVLLKADKRPRQLKDGTCQYLLWPTWARPSCPEAEFKTNGRCSHHWKHVVLFFVLFFLLNWASAPYLWSWVTRLSYSSTRSSTPSKFSCGLRGLGFESFPCKILTQMVHEIYTSL